MKKVILKVEGGIRLAKRNFCAIKGVARRLSVLLLNGPITSPSIIGIRAEDAKNEVKRKSAFLVCLRRPEIKAIRPEARAAAIKARGRARAAGRKFTWARIIAATNPPK